MRGVHVITPNVITICAALALVTWAALTPVVVHGAMLLEAIETAILPVLDRSVAIGTLLRL